MDNPSSGPKIKSPDDFIIYNIGRLYVSLDKCFSRVYAKFHLNPAKFNLLMAIKHVGKDAGISQMELGRHLYVSASNITKLIDGIERKGWAIRAPSVSDRRIKLIKITEDGSKLLDQVWVEHVAVINGLLYTFAQRDKDKLHHYLENFFSSIQMIKNINK